MLPLTTQFAASWHGSSPLLQGLQWPSSDLAAPVMSVPIGSKQPQNDYYICNSTLQWQFGDVM